jgi:hypothetical protein
MDTVTNAIQERLEAPIMTIKERLEAKIDASQQRLETKIGFQQKLEDDQERNESEMGTVKKAIQPTLETDRCQSRKAGG